MADEEAQTPPGGPDGKNPWRVQVAILVIVVLLGLVVYVTVKTTEIPITVALPLLMAAAFGLWAFKASDFTGKG